MDRRRKLEDIPFPGHPRALITAANGFVEPLRKSTGSARKSVRPIPDRAAQEGNPVEKTAPKDQRVADKEADDDDEDDEESDQSDGDSNQEYGIFAIEPDTLQPAHLQIIAKKIPREGLVSYQMKDGAWLTEYEVERLKNIERNKRLAESMEVNSAAAGLVSKKSTQAGKVQRRLDRVPVNRPSPVAPVTGKSKKGNL